MSEPVLPIDEIAKRDLEFFVLADCSSSMHGEKMATLNQAMREILNHDLPEVLKTQPTVQMNFRCIEFASHAKFSIGPKSVPIETVSWNELSANGSTSTADAINLLCTELDADKMPRRGFPPICILMSDGMCTQSPDEYEGAIKKLESLPWGKKAVRLSIGIGHIDDNELKQFISPAFRDEIGVLTATNKEQFVKQIRWASVSASMASSMTKSQMGSNDNSGANVIIAPPPKDVVESEGEDVF